jgi:7,8-dihydro-6-hydroxymethylpterin-pyrophosphokinase
MKLHEVIISLASNENQEANLAKAREQLTQLMADVHFTSAIWTKPYYNDHVQSSMVNGQSSMVNGQSKNYLNQLCKGTTAFGEGLLGEVLKETEKRIGRQHNEDGIVAIDLDLLSYDGQRHHLKDWNRDYVKNLLDEL